ncbi:MAG: prepilin-type N-terminal cleavage/methylation domain-containing protein [Gammaproteobacteria bacterium]
MNTIKYSKKQQGFTLVEIAIVLVIIGLLLGGVLKGQELINSARVRNMADQNSGIQAAYYGFVDRYRSVPGDMLPLDACNAIGANQLEVASCASYAIGGNGNGRLEEGDFPEAAAVWRHLTAANFLTNSYTGVAANNGVYTVNTVAPANAFGGRVLLGTTDTYLTTASSTASTRLGFIVGRETPVTILAELDTKVDNGKPQSGVLRATVQTSSDYGAVGERATGCVEATNNLWDVTNEIQDCNAIYLY